MDKKLIKGILYNSIKSIFSMWFLTFLLKIIVVPAILLLLIYIFLGGVFYSFVFGLLSNLTSSEIVLGLFKIASFLIVIISGIILYILIVIILVSLSLDMIINPIKRRYYSDVELRGFGKGIRTTFSIIFRTIKYYFVYVFMIPLLFIPVVNVIFPVIFSGIILDRTLLYEVSSIVLSREEYKNLLNHRFERVVLGLLGGLGEMLPIAFLFMPAIQAIMYIHFVFLFAKENRL